MGFLGKIRAELNFCNDECFCKLVILMVFLLKFNTLKITVFCKLIILVVFKGFLGVKSLV